MHTHTHMAVMMLTELCWQESREKCVPGLACHCFRVLSICSPSGTVLQSVEQICSYLLSEDTCKCGLECPIQVEQCFSFDVDVESQPWTVGSGSDTLASLCNHRRQVVALAAFHSSQIRAAGLFTVSCPTFLYICICHI